MVRILFATCLLMGSLLGCDSNEAFLDVSEMTFASEVIRFSPGEGSGFGGGGMPDVVLGPPQAIPSGGGSMNVLSLGAGGSIVLGFGDRVIVDGPGPDFIVFENAFQLNGTARVFQELGEVSVVSEKGMLTYPCDSQFQTGGCAGKTPTGDFPFLRQSVLDPRKTGGDAFDLADLGLASAAQVQIRDVSEGGAEPTAGFDLDAVGLVNWAWAEELEPR
jgi:hypothetical protein